MFLCIKIEYFFDIKIIEIKTINTVKKHGNYIITNIHIYTMKNYIYICKADISRDVDAYI